MIVIVGSFVWLVAVVVGFTGAMTHNGAQSHTDRESLRIRRSHHWADARRSAPGSRSAHSDARLEHVVGACTAHPVASATNEPRTHAFIPQSRAMNHREQGAAQ